MAISHVYLHIVVNIGNFTLLLTCSGQEWQFHISTGNFTFLLTSVLKNDNFTFLLTSSGQEWQFHMSTYI